MKKRTEKALALSLAAVMGLSLAGCGGGQSTTQTTAAAETKKETQAAEAESKETAAAETTAAEAAASTEPVTLRLSWWGGDSRHEATENAVKAFMEKYPNITVDCEYGAWSGWEEKQSLNILSGECADVIQIGSNWVHDYAKGGESYYDLYQLKDVIDLSQFPEEKLKLNEVNGKLMAIPISLTGRLFYWNKTTFDEIGCPIPTDEASLLAAGAAFKAYDEDYYPLALGEYDRMIFMVYYLESKYGKDWVTDGKMNYTEEEVKEGLEFMNKLEAEHVIPSIATIAGDMADSLDKNAKWIDGKYAGLMEWDSAVSKVKEAMEGSVNKPGQEFVIGEFINFGEYQGGFTKISMDFAIKASTEHPKEAALLLNYLLNDPEGVEICSTERGVPCSKVAIAHLNEKELGNAMVKEANAKVLDYSKFTQDAQFDNSELKANPDGLYYKVFGRLSAGEITPEEGAKAMCEGITTILEE
ncbi:MAG: ABC transporter substrate-binding protein [Lachnospiraceae bacterium]|nr:ABC transporter substrate-binding protein [Lachnospiraceae bacterium]